MKSCDQFTVVVWLVQLYIIITRPAILVSLVKTVYGRFLILATVVVLSVIISPLAGAAIAIIFVTLNNDSEGFESSSTSQESKNIDSFKDQHCQERNGETVFVDDQGNEETLEDMKKKYPHVKFDNGECNPCDKSCVFSIEQTDKLTVEASLRKRDETPESFRVV